MSNLQRFLEAPAPLALVAWVSAFFVGLTLLGLLIGFGIERGLPGRRIWALPLDPGQLRHELIGNLIFVPITIASFSLALGLRLARFGEDSLVSGLLTFAALSAGFQA